MPLTGDFAKLKKLQRNMHDLSKTGGRSQAEVARGVGREVKGVIREQFASGSGPYGAWQQTVRGKPALLSKKLPNDYKATPVPGGVVVMPSRAKWLIAHHEGHVFSARSVGAEQNFLTFNRAGRLIKASRALNKKTGAVRRGVFQIFAKAHNVGPRTLPARPIYPEGAIPTKWAVAINAGAAQGMQRWYERSLK